MNHQVHASLHTCVLSRPTQLSYLSTINGVHTTASPAHADGARVRAHTLETRNLSASAAASVQRAACSIELARKGRDVAMIFKKIDSTLRGNFAAEINEIMQTFDMQLCVHSWH